MAIGGTLRAAVSPVASNLDARYCSGDVEDNDEDDDQFYVNLLILACVAGAWKQWAQKRKGYIDMFEHYLDRSSF